MSNVVVVAVTIAAMLLQVTATDSRQDVENEIRVRKELIKLSILNKLGMQQPPKFSEFTKYDHDQEPGTRSAPELPEQKQQARQEDQQPRTRRNATSEMMKCNETLKCCRFPLMIDFQEFGWDWIIAPKHYYVNYCAGTCDPVVSWKYPHTHLANMTKSDTAPSCTPREMFNMSLLYYDQDFIIQYRSFPDMVVDRCGCS